MATKEITDKFVDLFEIAMISAYDGEGKVAPFGTHIDESAIKHDDGKYGLFPENGKRFADDALKICENLLAQMSDKIQMYLELMKNLNHLLYYSEEKMELHKKLAKEYFNYG